VDSGATLQSYDALGSSLAKIGKGFSRVPNAKLFKLNPKISVKMKKEGYFKQSYGIFLDSFKKIDLKIFPIVFFDLVFYSLIPLIAITSFNIVQKKAMSIDLGQNLLQMGAENAQALAANLQGFLFLLIGMMLLMLLTIIIDWSIFKGLAWGFTLKKKFSFNYFLRFFLLNLFWLGTLAVLMFLIGLAFKGEPLMLWGIYFQAGVASVYILILMAAWAYFTNIIYVLFLKDEKKAVRKALKLGFTKIHFFILPYVSLAAILLVLYAIMNLITSLPFGIGFTIMAFIMLFYLAWARYYVVGVVESIL